MNKELQSNLAVALERGRETYGKIRQKVVSRAKVTDEAIRTHPYRAIGVCVCLGALVGCVVARCSRNGA